MKYLSIFLSYFVVFVAGSVAGILLLQPEDSPRFANQFDQRPVKPIKPSPASNSSDLSRPLQSSNLSVGDYPTQVKELLGKKENALVRARIDLLIAEWAERQPIEALDFLIEEELYQNVDMIMEIAGDQSNEEIFLWLNENSSQQRVAYWSDTYLRHMAANSPLKALEGLAGLNLNGSNASARSVIIEQWASVNPTAALEWVTKTSLPDDESGVLRKTVLLQYAKVDPWYTSTLVATLDHIDHQRELIFQVAQNLAADDISRASDWAEGLPQQLRKAAIADLLSAWANTADTNDIIDYLSSRASDLSEQTVFESSISEIAARDPELVASRLSEFPDTLQSLIIRETVPNLLDVAGNDPETTVNLIESDALRDFAWERLVESSLQRDPAKAFRFASNIENPGQRKHVLSSAVRAWGKSNSTAAISSVNASEVWTAREKNALIENINSTN